MKIKTKVTIGILILVILILTQGIVCNMFLYRFSDASRNVLKDNYRTLQYCKEMISALDNIHQSYIFFELQPMDSMNKKYRPDYAKAKAIFERQLKAEENNITESGEKETVESLRANYENYINLIADSKTSVPQQTLKYYSQLTFMYGRIKNDIVSIMNMNMDAITRKSEMAESANERAVWYVSLIEGIAMIIALPMLFLFPSYVAGFKKDG